jgi:tripartite-type tricarboxylate transporter receptor subunit TctC
VLAKKITRIPYKGPAMTDLLGGHVTMMFLSILPVLEHVRAGTLRALAVTRAARSNLLPDVPTIAQSGVPGFSAVIHYGLLAPAGTPRDIIDRLNAALEAALSADDCGRGLPQRAPCRHRAPRRTMPPTSTARRGPGAHWCANSI